MDVVFGEIIEPPVESIKLPLPCLHRLVLHNTDSETAFITEDSQLPRFLPNRVPSG